jgi:hypothetical protein
MTAKGKAFHAKHKAFDAKTMKAHPERTALATRHTAALAKEPQRLAAVRKGLAAGPKVAAVAGGPGKTVQLVKTWNFNPGNNRTVSAFLEGKLEVKGSTQGVDVLGEAAAGGYLVNHRIELLKATGTIHAPEKGTGNARLSVAVVGRTVVNLNQNVTTSWSKSDQFSTGTKQGVSFTFPVGPIPLSVEVGAQGNVGVRYFLGLRPLHATAQIIPNASVKVYATAAVNLVVAKGGAGAELTLLALTLTLGAELGVDSDSRGLFISEHIYAQNELEMLSGKIFLWAEVTVPRLGIPPWTKKHYQWDWFNFTGFKTKGYLFNINNRTPLTGG